MGIKHALPAPKRTVAQWRKDWLAANRPPEQINEFCKETPCASDACRRAKRCLHSS